MKEQKEVYNFMHNFISNLLNNEIEDTHEEYLNKLDEYKAIVDKTPNKFLKFHLDDQLKKEHYELVQYISDTADKRGFNLDS